VVDCFHYQNRVQFKQSLYSRNFSALNQNNLCLLFLTVSAQQLQQYRQVSLYVLKNTEIKYETPILKQQNFLVVRGLTSSCLVYAYTNVVYPDLQRIYVLLYIVFAMVQLYRNVAVLLHKHLVPSLTLLT
jgi:hypothetical protein